MADLSLDVDLRGPKQMQEALRDLEAQFTRTSKSARDSASVFERSFQQQTLAARTSNGAMAKSTQDWLQGERRRLAMMQESERMAQRQAQEEVRAAQEIARAKQQQAQREDFLRQKYDESYRAMVIYRNQVMELNEALQLGAINQTQYGQQIDKLNQQMANGSILMLNASQKSRERLNQFGQMTQQVGYQVGDFLVQVQSGTNWMVAFGQQATQIAGTLTQFGGKFVAIGAVLSVVIPLATAVGAAFMRTNKATKEASAAADMMNSSLQNLDRTLKEWVVTKRAAEAGISVDQLFGAENLETVIAGYQETLNSLLEQAQQGSRRGAQDIADLEAKITEARRAFQEQLSANTEREIQQAQERLQVQELYNQKLAEGVIPSEAMAQAQYEIEKATILSAIASGKLTNSQVMAAAENLRLLESTYALEGALRDSEAETKLLEQGLSRSVVEGLKLAGIDLSNLSDAANDVARLATNLKISVEEAAKLRLEQGTLDRLNQNAGRGSTSNRPVSWGDGTPVDVDPDTPSRGGGSRSGVEGLIGQLRTERETLEAWYAESQELLMNATNAELEIIGGANEARIRLEQEYQDRLKAIRAASTAQTLQDTANLFGALAGIASAGGQKMVKVVATFQAIEGTINAYGAAIKALNTPGISLFGRFAAYASVLSAGLKGVAAIRSAGGIGGGGGSGGPGTSTVAPSSAAPSPQTVFIDSITPDSLYSGQTLINLFDSFYNENDRRGKVFIVAR